MRSFGSSERTSPCRSRRLDGSSEGEEDRRAPCLTAIADRRRRCLLSLSLSSLVAAVLRRHLSGRRWAQVSSRGTPTTDSFVVSVARCRGRSVDLPHSLAVATSPIPPLPIGPDPKSRAPGGRPSVGRSSWASERSVTAVRSCICFHRRRRCRPSRASPH